MKRIVKIGLFLAMLVACFSMAWAAPVEITWWSPIWGQVRAQELIKKFEAENPDIKVNLQTTVANDLQNKVLITLQSGSAPDLIDIQNGWNTPYAEMGGLLALDKMVADSKVNVADFVKVGWQTAKTKNKVYGIPYRMEAHGLIYNKRLYKEAGLDPNRPPLTWDELIAYSQKLTKKTSKGDQYGYGICGGGEIGNMIYRLVPQIWMNGGEVLSKDNSKALINQAAAVKAVEFYTGMFTKYKVSPPSTLENDGLALRKLFDAELLAQYQQGPSDLAPIKSENPDIELGVGPIPAPKGKKPTAMLGGWNFVIPAKAPHPKEAWKFILFLIKPANAAYYTDTFPATYSAMKEPRFAAPELKGFIDMLPFARPAPNTKAWIQISQIIYNNVQKVLLGESNAQTAMNAAAQQINNALAVNK